MNGKKAKKLRREAREIMGGDMETVYHRMEDGSIRSMSVKAFAKFLNKTRKESA